MSDGGGVAVQKEPFVIESRLQGLSITDIGQALGVTTGCITRTLERPHVRAAIDQANRDALQAIVDERGKAVRIAFAALIRLIEGEPDLKGERQVPHTVQRRAARDLLEVCGVTPKLSVEVTGGFAVVQVVLADLTPEQLAAMAWQDSKERGRIVDVLADSVDVVVDVVAAGGQEDLDMPNEAK